MGARERITSASCRTCGACCWSMQDQGSYCDVTPQDVKKLPKKFVRLHVVQPHPVERLARIIDRNPGPFAAIATTWVTQREGPFKGVDALVCSALRGSLMHRVSCSIYEKRPEVCRKAVKPGDRSCRAIRRMFRRAAQEESV